MKPSIIINLTLVFMLLASLVLVPGNAVAEEHSATENLPKRVLQVVVTNLVATQAVEGKVLYALTDAVGTQEVSQDFALGLGDELNQLGEFTYQGDSVSWSIEIVTDNGRLMSLAGIWPGIPFNGIGPFGDILKVVDEKSSIIVLQLVAFKLSLTFSAVLDRDVENLRVIAGLDSDASGEFEKERGELVTLSVAPKDRRINVSVPPMLSATKKAKFLLQLIGQDGSNLGELKGTWEFEDVIGFALTSQRLGIIKSVEGRATHSQTVVVIALPNPFLPPLQTVGTELLGQGIGFSIQRNPEEAGPIPPPPQTGWLSLSAMRKESLAPLPDIIITIEDQGIEAETGTTGQVTIPLAPGSYSVTVTSTEFPEVRLDVNIELGETTIKEVLLAPPPVPWSEKIAEWVFNNWLYLIGGLFGGLVLAVTIGTLISQGIRKPQAQW